MRLPGYAAALLLGLAAGVAAVALHRTLPGLVLGAGAAMVTLWAIRQWMPTAAAAFAAGWLLPLLAALSGRGEGDYAVAADTRGYLLIAAGVVVLVTGLLCAVLPLRRRDSSSGGTAT